MMIVELHKFPGIPWVNKVPKHTLKPHLVYKKMSLSLLSGLGCLNGGMHPNPGRISTTDQKKHTQFDLKLV